MFDYPGPDHYIQIYRCWIIWNQNYYVVSPLVFLAAASLREDYNGSLIHLLIAPFKWDN
jgi:hypothetical protein